MDKNKIIKIVTNEICNMLCNDILCENGVECFKSWCEDGEIFENEGHSKEDTKEIMSFVEEIAPLVDDLVCNKLNIDMY
jgi:hypothetical protein